MSELSRSDIRKLVVEAMLSSAPKEKARKSEMKQFSESRSGKKVMDAGRKIKSCASGIREVADDQTGKMRETLGRISEFVEKLGESLASMDSLNEGSSMCENLPTISELKQLHKDIANLEK